MAVVVSAAIETGIATVAESFAGADCAPSWRVAGAANAALFAVAMLAGSDPGLATKLAAFRVKQTNAARAMRVPPSG